MLSALMDLTSPESSFTAKGVEVEAPRKHAKTSWRDPWRLASSILEILRPWQWILPKRYNWWWTESSILNRSRSATVRRSHLDTFTSWILQPHQTFPWPHWPQICCSGFGFVSHQQVRQGRKDSEGRWNRNWMLSLSDLADGLIYTVAYITHQMMYNL